MRVGYVVFMVFMTIVLQLSLVPLGNASMDSGMRTDLNTLSSFGIVTENQSWGPLKYITAPYNYVSSLLHLLTVNGTGAGSPLFPGSFELFRWIVIAPVFAGIIFGLILVFFSLFSRLVT